MFKLFRFVVSTTLLLSALSYFGFIEFTPKGKEKIQSLKAQIQEQLEARLSN